MNAETIVSFLVCLEGLFSELRVNWKKLKRLPFVRPSDALTHVHPAVTTYMLVYESACIHLCGYTYIYVRTLYKSANAVCTRILNTVDTFHKFSQLPVGHSVNNFKHFERYGFIELYFFFFIILACNIRFHVFVFI